MGIGSIYAAPIKSGNIFYDRVHNFSQIVFSNVITDRNSEKTSVKLNRNGIASIFAKVISIVGKKEVVIEQVKLSDVREDPVIEKQSDMTSEKIKAQKVVQETVGSNSDLVSRGGTMVSKAEIEILARIIHAEARGESFEGQVAVGAVVLNRVQNNRFPETISKVVYQQGQFTAVYDKQIELDPDSISFKAAEAALEGQDPSNGALFYYNPKLATDKWIRTRTVVKSIGNHNFCV